MFELIWQDGVLYTRGNRELMRGSLTECAIEFPDVVILYVGR